ncbi:unnamed protein product [Orchesella dallaii]|uniref:Uncharacterized protein n=1 Tax=Orchesella dallaii TaxID=48710 RepID=A0ABP1PK45_9HEXA
MMASRRVTKEQMLKSVDEKIEGVQRSMRETLVVVFDATSDVNNTFNQLKEVSANVKATKDEMKEIKDSIIKEKADVENQRHGVIKIREALDVKESELQKREVNQREREQKFAKYEDGVNGRLAVLKKGEETLQADRKNFQDQESKQRKLIMELNLREGDCRKKEELLAKRETELAAKERGKEQALKQAHQIQIEMEHKQQEILAKERKIEMLMKENETVKRDLQQRQSELNIRESEINDKVVNFQDIEAQLALDNYEGQGPKSRMGPNANINTPPANRLSETWVPAREFLNSVKEYVDPSEWDTLMKLATAFPTETYIKCPRMSFAVGLEQQGGRIDEFVCGHGESPNNTASNTITQMRKKVKELHFSGRNPSRAASHKGPLF